MNSTISQLSVELDTSNESAFSLQSLASLFQLTNADKSDYELPDWLIETEAILPLEVADLCKSISEQTIWPREQTAILDFPNTDSIRKMLEDRRSRQEAPPPMVIPKRMEPVEKSPAGLIEVYSDRPFFRYCTSETSTFCSYGDFAVSCKTDNKQEVLTYTSILDVYDRYGLSVCSAYLKSLYNAVIAGSYSARSFLLYVCMSLAGLDIEEARSYSQQLQQKTSLSSVVNDCCLTFMVLLEDYDEKQPRLLTELQEATQELPVEVLALIFRSRRISKTIGHCFISLRLKQRSCLLRERELAARSLCVPSIGFGTRMWSSSYTTIVLQDDRALLTGDMYSIMSLCNITQEEVKINSQLYSWRDYARLIRREEKQVFEEMIKQVDTSDITQVSSWIIVLLDRDKIIYSSVCDGRDIRPDQWLTIQQLRELYCRLVEEVMLEYQRAEDRGSEC